MVSAEDSQAVAGSVEGKFEAVHIALGLKCNSGTTTMKQWPQEVQMLIEKHIWRRDGMKPKQPPPKPKIRQEHGIEGASYSGGSGEPYYQPTMDCMCGWGTGRCENWEEAGRKFDEHLEQSS